MCGIVALLGSQDASEEIDKVKWTELTKCSGRGPEDLRYERVNPSALLGFHRLAINGYGNNRAMQPLHIGQCSLICNGEIYNWRSLYEEHDIVPATGSDCEVIAHLYMLHGIEETLKKLDGVFAFVLFDHTSRVTILARDRFGVRPLFVRPPAGPKDICLVASEMKAIAVTDGGTGRISQFPPGHFLVSQAGIAPYLGGAEPKPYGAFPLRLATNPAGEPTHLQAIRKSLAAAVGKRTRNTDRGVTCLLSGGLDSSLVAALVASQLPPGTLHTWSIGLKGSEDLAFAALAAKHIGTVHHSIEVEEDEFLACIEDVIYAIESYDTTTVRASVGNWLISRYIRENSDDKVVFNGDGSDEVCGGYLYMHCAPTAREFDKECRRLLRDIHFFDVLRSDRSISAHGLEARTPFLDAQFVETYLAIPEALRFHAGRGQCEKYLLRKAFDGSGLLPPAILWRRKEAFSDGVSKSTESWFEIIQRHAFALLKAQGVTAKSPAEAEKLYYRSVFDRHYRGNRGTIPYMWMPKFVEAADASARTLDIYANKKSLSK